MTSEKDSRELRQNWVDLTAAGYRTNMQTQTPEFDSFTGAMEVQGYYLSSLGTMLLREIGLGEDESTSS